MEELLYWLMEYGKVFLGYGFLMFVWPLVVLRNYLNGKSVTFKFSFCVTAQVVLINTVVLLLGLLHILNDWTMRLLFYGSFLFSIRKCFALTPERKKKIKYLVHGSFGWRNFFLLERRKYVGKLEGQAKRFWGFYKKHWLEYSLLVVAVVYGMVYFSWGVLHDRSYGFSDMYVHHAWIYQLSLGNPFSAGIYPEGMHCVVYALNALFGIRLYSCMLFVSSANIVSILLAIYCFFKEIFHRRLSAVLVLFIFLTLGGINGVVITCMSRLQCSLPQEFAFTGVFLCATFLLRYLRSVQQNSGEKKEKWCWNENLLVFSLAFTMTVVVHFYATFMAFFLCLGIAICSVKQIFTKRSFFPLVLAVLFGGAVSVMPMVAAYATGIPLQGSLYWAMSVMDVSTNAEDDNKLVEEVIHTQDFSENTDIVQGTEKHPDAIQKESEDKLKEHSIGIKEKVGNIFQYVKEKIEHIISKSLDIYNKIYHVNFLTLYDKKIAELSVIFHGILFIIGILFLGVKLMIKKQFRQKYISKLESSGYFTLFFMSLIYIIVYSSPGLGLPVIIDSTRICAIVYLLDIAVFVGVFDVLFYVAGNLLTEKKLQAGSSLVIMVITVGIMLSDYFHGYLYFALTRFDVTVQITNQIIDELPKESFTIVSPTEELYQVIEHGYHEEILTFLNNQEKDTYTLPTKYVFVFVEKKPLRYVQIHSFSGPAWLARDRYYEVMYKKSGSVWPDYVGSEITEEEAGKEIIQYRKLSDSYSQLESRTIIESKLYYWCEDFMSQYPNEVKIFYEDEYFVCYYWKQNTQRLYNLGLK